MMKLMVEKAAFLAITCSLHLTSSTFAPGTTDHGMTLRKRDKQENEGVHGRRMAQDNEVVKLGAVSMVVMLVL